eukprot:gene6585-1175_t
MALLLGAILLAHVRAQGTADDNCKVLSSENAVVVEWSTNDRLDFQISHSSGTPAEWVALGLGGSPQMNGMDIVMGYQSGTGQTCIRGLRSAVAAMPPAGAFSLTDRAFFGAPYPVVAGSVDLPPVGLQSAAWAFGPTGGHPRARPCHGAAAWPFATRPTRSAARHFVNHLRCTLRTCGAPSPTVACAGASCTTDVMMHTEKERFSVDWAVAQRDADPLCGGTAPPSPGGGATGS